MPDIADPPSPSSASSSLAAAAVIEATTAARVIVLGGEPLDGPRFIEWNFVSSDKARLARAKDDWRAGRFPPIQNDDGPPIPLPEMLR